MMAWEIYDRFDILGLEAVLWVDRAAERPRWALGDVQRGAAIEPVGQGTSRAEAMRSYAREVGRRLRELRRERGLTIAQAVRQMCLSAEKAYIRWESGQAVPSKAMAARLNKFFGFGC